MYDYVDTKRFTKNLVYMALVALTVRRKH